MRNDGHPKGSWYAETAAIRLPDLPAPEGDVRTGVCVVGAGFTGLGAALALARAGVPVVVLEAARVGSGASGRNGGQVHPGHRQEPEWLEARVGRDLTRRLWDLAEAGRAHLSGLVADVAPEAGYRPGLLTARHRPGGEAEDARHIEHLARNYGYPHLSLLSREALAEELGTDVYHGGFRDDGGGHLHSLNLALGLARAVLAAGGVICEGAPALSWSRRGGGIEVVTPTARIACDRLVLTGDGYLTPIAGEARDQVMPINNFVLVTEPLGARAGQEDVLGRQPQAQPPSRWWASVPPRADWRPSKPSLPPCRRKKATTWRSCWCSTWRRTTRACWPTWCSATRACRCRRPTTASPCCRAAPTSSPPTTTFRWRMACRTSAGTTTSAGRA